MTRPRKSTGSGSPLASMIRTIWGDDERYRKSYYPDEFHGKYYLAGDGASRDAKTGYFTITGRIDDVLNVSGHRMLNATVRQNTFSMNSSQI